MGISDLPEPLRQRFQNFGLARTLATKISEFWTCPNPCVKDFRILDLSEPLRQRFQNFGPARTLATKIVAIRIVIRELRRDSRIANAMGTQIWYQILVPDFTASSRFWYQIVVVARA